MIVMKRAALAYARVLHYRLLPLCWPDADGNCACPGQWDREKRCYVPHAGRDVGKAPIGSLVRHGFEDATDDEEMIGAWWDKYPCANIGYAIPRGVFIVDCDPRNGGDEAAADLEREYGRFPDTVTALTGSGGWHRHYAYDPEATDIRQRSSSIGSGLDIKTGGLGYVVLPPSLHVSGNRYQWEISSRPEENDVAGASEWLIKLVSAGAAAKPENHSHGEPLPIGKAALTFIAFGAPMGEQRGRAVGAARNLMAAGKTAEETTALLMRAFENSPQDAANPWTEDDAGSIVSYIASHPAPKLQDRPNAGGERAGSVPPDDDRAEAPPPGAAEPGRGDTAAPEPGTGTTDLANAERFIHQHGANVKFVPAWKCWVVWDETRWRRDDLRLVQDLAIRTVRSIYSEVKKVAAEAEVAALAAGGSLFGSEHDRAAAKSAHVEALAKHARASEADNRIKALLSVAQNLPGVAVRPEVFDSDLWLLNCTNGTVDLRTGDLHQHRREDMITKLCPVAYRKDATAPTWAKFLHRVMDGNEDKIAYLRRAFGYSLTGHTGEECLFFCYGTGRNGKSKALGTFEHILGDYAMATRPETFTAKKTDNGAATPDLADLAGVRFAPTIETAEGSKVAEALLKWATGGDKIKARHLHANLFAYQPQFKLWLAGNHKPRITGTDDGIWSRIRTIPFTVTIPPEERDKQLGAKLQAEAEGILAWAVSGCLDWQINGLGEPEEVRQAGEAYRQEMDLLGAFLSDCCVLGDAYEVTAKALRKAYEDWCEQAGETPLHTSPFGKKLRDHGFNRRKSDGNVWWRGLGLTQ